MPRGIFKRTKEHRLAMSIGCLKRPKRKLSNLHKLRIGLSSRGRKVSNQTREKIRKANSGENSYNWKGDKVGYRQLHAWVSKQLGTPKRCAFCKSKEKVRYHWANISKMYKRILSDWVRLCVSCHKKFDLKNRR